MYTLSYQRGVGGTFVLNQSLMSPDNYTHLSGVALEGVIPLAFGVKEDLRLAIGARDTFPMPRVDFQPGKGANFDLQHFRSGFLASFKSAK